MKAFTIEVFVELHKHRDEEVKEFQAPRAVLVVAGIGNILERIEVSKNGHPQIIHLFMFFHGFSIMKHPANHPAIGVPT